MDDSGFFSSQVMDEALKPFGLQLVRWRSERMRPFQEAPEQQQAFILNFKEHWFCIRRFGFSKHFWFDLNSFHTEPRHVSPMYLGLQIDQAEHEGYSVFVAMSVEEQSGDLVPANLPACIADEEVYKVAEETRSSRGFGSSEGFDRRTQALMDDESIFTSSGAGPSLSSGFGNEDEELNRAIEESLKGQGAYQPKSTATQQAPPVEEEDPELAAAIAASLEGVEAAANASEDVKMEQDEAEEEEKPMTAEDMRKARLARFGQ